MTIDFIEEGARISFGGKNLAATVHRPGNAGTRVPAVLFCHGYMGNRIEQRYIFVRMARCLSSFGIGSLRYDYPGCGESDGLFKDQTMEQYIESAECALGYLEKQPWHENMPAGILGYSMGGSVAAHILSRHTQLKTGVLWSAVAFPHDIFFKNRPDLGEDELLASNMRSFEYGGWEIGMDFIRSLKDKRPTERLAEYPGPIMLAHGLQDTVVPPSHTEAYLGARINDTTTITLLLPGSGHGYKPLHEDEKLLQETARWFDKYLH